MNIKSFMKKYGVLSIVAIVFVVAIIYFAIDTNKDVIKGKKVDGKDVVVSMDGYNLTADDLYEELLDSQYGPYAVYVYYTRAVANASVVTTDEIQSSAEYYADQVEAQYSDEKEFSRVLRQFGLRDKDDLIGYYVSYFKLQDLQTQYIDAHKDELFKEFFEERQPRVASHILVKCADPDNPTSEEKAKMAAVDADLAANKPFADIAKEYSDDGSASDGGNLGYSDASTNYVSEFLKAELALGTNEMSDWVKTEYGYHRILVTASTYDEMIANEDALNAMAEYYDTLQYSVVKEAASKLDIKFTNEKCEELLNEFFKEVIGEEAE